MISHIIRSRTSVSCLQSSVFLWILSTTTTRSFSSSSSPLLTTAFSLPITSTTRTSSSFSSFGVVRRHSSSSWTSFLHQQQQQQQQRNPTSLRLRASLLTTVGQNTTLPVVIPQPRSFSTSSSTATTVTSTIMTPSSNTITVNNGNKTNNNSNNRRRKSKATTNATRHASSSAAAVDLNLLEVDIEEEENKDAAVVFPKFAQLQNPPLHPWLLDNVLKNFQFDAATEIQFKTWSPAASGQDVLARSLTGSGKTLSFLMPALQRLWTLQQQQPQALPSNTIHVLILSPTRELAAQIDDQTQLLFNSNNNNNNKSHKNNSGFTRQVMFGGASKPKDISQLERQVPTVLTATPGRLKDHLQTTHLKNHGPFANLLKRTSILVLDETDRLLDMGFRREVDEILSYLPSKEKRQTLLFSATVPPEVKAVMAKTMKSNFVTVDCIHDAGLDASHTNAQVVQTHVILDSQTRLVSGMIDLLHKIISTAQQDQKPLKMVVFFTTAHLVSYYAQLFNECLGITVAELHSRKSQSHRTRVADAFRVANEAILFTSDVSARGVDYPNVTHVIQCGMADSRESYIHRLGRTGRAGQSGIGVLVLTELEQNFVKDSLRDLDVPVHDTYQELLDGPPTVVALQAQSRMVQNDSLTATARAAYRSMLGFYNGKLGKLMSKSARGGGSETGPLVEFVNGFARQAGLKEIPELERKTAGKMGLTGVKGLNIVPNGTAAREKGSNNPSSKNNASGGGSSSGGRTNGRGGGGGHPGEAGRGGGGRGGSSSSAGRGSDSHRTDQSSAPMKRHNSVASEMEAAPHQAKKARSPVPPRSYGSGGGGGGYRTTSSNGGGGGGGGREDGPGRSYSGGGGGRGGPGGGRKGRGNSQSRSNNY